MNEGYLQVIVETLKHVTNSRFFHSERGYQGEFLRNFTALLHQKGIMPSDAVVEQEYQKNIPSHNISHRPDLIVHIPFEGSKMQSRKAGNFIAIELKIKANKEKAQIDFAKLRDYIEILNYPLGAFININSLESFVEFVPDERIHVFNVLRKVETITVKHSYIRNTKTYEEIIT